MKSDPGHSLPLEWEQSHRNVEQDPFRDCSPWNTRVNGQQTPTQPYSLRNILSILKTKPPEEGLKPRNQAYERLSCPKKRSLVEHRRQNTQEINMSFLTAQREQQGEQPVYMSASQLIPQYLPRVSNRRRTVSVDTHLLKSKAIQINSSPNKHTIHSLNNIKVRLMSRKLQHIKAKAPSRTNKPKQPRQQKQRSIGTVEGRKHYPRSVKGYFNNSIYRAWNHNRQQSGVESHSIAFHKY